MEAVGLSPAFWRGRRVFVTGHTGFKGSWLLAMLDRLGAVTAGYALAPPTDPALFDLLGLAEACAHTIGDIRDAAAVQHSVASFAPEVVIHLAAQPLVRASYAAPVETFAVNVMGTVTLLEACRGIGSIRAIVIVTTDKCYENAGWPWGYREIDRLGGHDPYAASKAACEIATESYARSFFADAAAAAVASARAGNVIGGGDFAADRLIPDAIRAFAAGQVLRIRNPDAIRPWQHVLEPLHGYLRLAEAITGDRTLAGAWNFGPPAEGSASVATVIEQVRAGWGTPAEWALDDGDQPHEAALLTLDSSKARAGLGWRPRIELGEAVAMTTSWYRAWAARGDAAALLRGQVDTYLSEVCRDG